MARLHLLRRGTGDRRVASSFEVSVERVRALYGDARVQSSGRMPAVNGEEASPLLGPEFAVIELVEGEVAFTRFRSPGFNILVGVDPREAYRSLVQDTST